MKLLVLCVPVLLIIAGCKESEQPSGPGGPPSAQFDLAEFESAADCQSCHPQYYEEWSASMHAYSASDPIWMLANNGLQSSTGGRLGPWCWQCHAPLGFLTGNTLETFQFSDIPDKVREGINCDFCHVMRGPHATTDQNIVYNIEPGPVKYGRIEDPVPAGVHESRFDASYGRSEVCRECHDLIINSVPVEMTFTEWMNSAYGAMGLECQNCHMPTYTGNAAVGGPVRENLHRHDFIGVDVAITDFPGKAEQLAAVDALLKNAVSVSVDAPASAAAQMPVTVSVAVTNDRTGHNVPSSVFFNRQMWLEVFVWSGSDTVYRSGHLDANGDLLDGNSEIAPGSDLDLTLFAGTLYKDGEPTNVFELDSLVNNSLAPFEMRVAEYAFSIPNPGSWNLRVRLLFRPFGPYLFRGVGAAEYVSEIPTFEMFSDAKIIEVM